MAGSIENKDNLMKIKEEWVNQFLVFCEPVLNLESEHNNNAFHYYVLEK